MAQLLDAFLNAVAVIFYMLALAGVVALLVGSLAIFIILAAGFGKQALEEHENNRGE